MRNILAFFAIILLFSCQTKTKTTPEEDKQLSQLKKVLYKSTAPLFASYPEGLQVAKPQNGLPWITDKNRLKFDVFMTIFRKNAKTSISKYAIGEKANFEIEEELDQRWLTVELLSSDLRAANGDLIILDEKGSLNSGTSSKSKKVNGKFISKTFNTFGVTFAPSNNSEIPAEVQGTITYKISYADEFDVVALDKSLIGTSLKFANSNVTLMEINGNQAVYIIDNMSPADFNVKNTAEGKVELAVDFDKRKELNLGVESAEKTGLIDIAVYDIFKSKPNITLDSFGDAIHNHLVSKMRGELQDSAKVFVTNMLGPIEVLTLYKQKIDEKKEQTFSMTI